jgi:hypothetical protein
MNVLRLGGRVIGDGLALKLVKTFLLARFSGAERHMRRLVKRFERSRRRRSDGPRSLTAVPLRGFVLQAIDRRPQQGGVDHDDMDGHRAKQIREAALGAERLHEGAVLQLRQQSRR